MGNNHSNDSHSDVIDPDDSLISSLIDEVSDEIDDDYKEDETMNSKPSEFAQPIDFINELYKHQKIIGKGVSGSVFLVQSKDTYKQYALKTMPRSDKLNLFSFDREINILNQLNHPNIVNLHGAYISSEYYYITTEFCSGGTLLERIVKMKRFSERDYADFKKSILEALQYMHSKNIVHRDIKLSNIVFDHTNIAHSTLKLIDFGQSEEITDLDKIDKSIVGSLRFFPPETVRHRRKRELFAGDIWAVGIVAYLLIEGKWPYDGNDILCMMKSIAKRKLRWNDKIPISKSCKDFIYSLLNKDANQRINATQALNHPWIINQATDDNLGDAYFEILTQLHFQNKLQRVMVHAVLDGMEETDKKRILSQDGYVDDNELINQIISGRTPWPIPSKRRAKLDVPYKHTSQITDKSLDEMDIDNILSEIDMESAPSVSPASPTSLDTPASDVCNDDGDDASTPIPTASSPSMDDIMSVERFTEILQSSSKKYDTILWRM